MTFFEKKEANLQLEFGIFAPPPEYNEDRGYWGKNELEKVLFGFEILLNIVFKVEEIKDQVLVET